MLTFDKIKSGTPSFLAMLLPFLATIAAWDYGGILPWTKWALSVGCLILLVCVFPLLLRRASVSWNSLLIPLIGLAFWGYGLFQLTPLDPDWVRILSPGTAAAYTDWLPQQFGFDLQKLPLTIDPSLTESYLVIPALFSAAALLSAVIVRERRELVLFLAVVTISGVFISYVGIADKINTHSDRLITPDNAALPFGTFVNRNNAAGYLNLCLACAVGWMTLRHRTRLREQHYDARYSQPEGSAFEQLIGRFRRFLRISDNHTIVIFVFIVIIACGTLATGSRGGMLAMGVGVLTCLLRATIESKKLTAVLFASTAIGIMALLMGSIGMISQVHTRFHQTFGQNVLKDNRLDHWQDSLVAAQHYLPLGSGMGTYRYAYMPYQSEGGPAWYMNADGMPFEWLLECGIPGILLILLGLGCVYRSLLKSGNHKSSPTQSAVFMTGWFATSSLLVTQLFDFGILLPANTLLAGMIIGCFSGVKVRRSQRASSKGSRSSGKQDRVYSSSSRNVPRRYKSSQTESSRSSSRGRKPLIAVASIVWILCAVATLHSIKHQDAAARIDKATRDVYRWRPDLVDAVERIQEIEGRINALVQQYPDQSELLYAASNARILTKRIALVYEQGAKEVRNEFETQWLLTDPLVQRQRFHTQRVANQDEVKWSQFLLSTQSEAELIASHKEAANGLRYSPLHDRLRVWLLSLDFVDGSFTASQDLIEQFYQLRVRNPDHLDKLALIASVHPGTDEAVRIWKTELELAPERIPRIWKQIGQLQIETNLSQLVPEDLSALLYVAESIATDEKTRNELIARIDAALPEDPSSAEAVSLTHIENADAEDSKDDLSETSLDYFLGRLLVLKGDYEQAEEHFARAVEFNPTDQKWRLRYIDTLEHNGEIEKALKEIERLTLQDPSNESYIQLQDRVIKAPLNRE